MLLKIFLLLNSLKKKFQNFSQSISLKKKFENFLQSISLKKNFENFSENPKKTLKKTVTRGENSTFFPVKSDTTFHWVLTFFLCCFFKVYVCGHQSLSQNLDMIKYLNDQFPKYYFLDE